MLKDNNLKIMLFIKIKQELITLSMQTMVRINLIILIATQIALRISTTQEIVLDFKVAIFKVIIR